MKICPKCTATKGHCAECGKSFKHGTASHCDRLACKEVNAPIDCECGLVVCQDLSGVLDLDMNLHRWKEGKPW